MEFAATDSLEEILQKTLDEVGEITESPIGFYHFVEDDQQTLSLQAWSTRTVQEFCTARAKGSHYSISDAGVWVDCIHQRRPVIHNDYTSLPHRKGMPEGHAQVTRELVVPILRGGRIVAILGVGNKQSEYTEKDVELVSYLADVAWEIAARKRAEAALRESEQRLNRAQEIAHLGSWELDLVNNRLIWSDEVYRIFGLEPQAFGATYEAFLEAVHPDDRAAVDAAYSGSLRENRDSYEIEHRVVRKWSGEIRLVHERCQHLRDATGRIVRSVGMVHDITERKRLEETLHTQAEQYSTIVATTSDGFWLVDDKARLLDVNEAYCGMSGYTREELLRLCIPDLEAVEKADEIVDHMRKIIESGSDRFETRHRTKDGRLFDVEISTTFLVSKGWFIVFIRDITEHKQADEVLREREEQFRATFELAAVGMVQSDPRTGCLLRVNKKYCAITGYPADELLGKGFPEITHPEDRQRDWETFQRAVRGETPDYRSEKRYVRKDGTVVWVNVNAAMLRDSAGQPVRTVAAVEDITKRKRAEEALRESEEALRQANEQLEEKVQERTLELRVLMENLEKSRDDLRKLASELVLAEEQERKRISVVLHDEVAQTLAAARTRLERLRNMPCNDDFRQSITEAQELIGQSIRETRALMTDISSPVLYEMGLRSAVETLAGEVTARHGLALACSFDGSLGPLDPDLKVMLFQVVKELVQNVVKHSRARNASIRIVEEKDSIRAVVADNGQGFDVRNLRSPGFEGGFGLFSIRERVNFFNGSIAIESKPGTGTEVTVVLPKGAGKHESASEANERGEDGKTDPTCS
jgi:PAS domain S-box-containing protein